MRYVKDENRRTIASAQIVARVLAALLLIVSLTLKVSPAAASAEALDARQLVERARMTFDSFQADDEMGSSLQALVRKAKGVLIYPQVLRGAFIVGGAGGNGVFLVRKGENDTWSGPAFYTIGEASFGLQAGADASEVVLVALTDRGVAALLSTSAKLGAKASVAVGPIGVGAEAATANLSADLVSYTRNKGLYAGVSVDGAVVASRDSLNQSYYGKPATPTEILIEREVSNPQAAGLIAAVARVAGGSASVKGKGVTAKAK